MEAVSALLAAEATEEARGPRGKWHTALLSIWLQGIAKAGGDLSIKLRGCLRLDVVCVSV